MLKHNNIRLFRKDRIICLQENSKFSKKKYIKNLEIELKKAKYDLLILEKDPNIRRNPKFYTKKTLKVLCHFRCLDYKGSRKTLIYRILKYEKENNYVTWPNKREIIKKGWV